MAWGRKGFSAALLVVAGLMFYVVLLMAEPSEAQDLNCSDFDFQEDAQEELESNPSDPNNLDNDNDGIACESLPRRGGDGGTPGSPPANTLGDLDCADFDSQEEAQAEFDEDPDDPNGLDADGDGIVCESLRTGDGDADDEADDPATPDAQQDQDERSTDGSASSQSTARAGGAFAQSSSEVSTPERRNRNRRDNVVRGTIPDKPLPPTGGLPAYVMVTGSLLVGTGLLGLGFVVRNGAAKVRHTRDKQSA